MDEYIEMRVLVKANQIQSVYAVLAGSTAIAPATSHTSASTGDAASDPVPVKTEKAEAIVDVPEGIDTDGHPWSAELHSPTGSKTKAGLWRMKAGVERPSPLEGFPVTEKEDTGTEDQVQEDSKSQTSATELTVTETENVPETVTDTQENDEFAAFAAAAKEVETTKTVEIPEREWADTDLGVLCNKAAVKMGDPSKIKEVIAKYIPEGQVSHSRNIPESDRAAFAAEIEEVAGIKFDS